MSKIKSLFGAAILGLSLFGIANAPAFAEEATDASEIDTSGATSISITPVSKVLTLESNTVYEDTFKVINNGTSPMTFEVYASPYSFVTSADSDTYSLNFNTQTSFTQIARWVTFKDIYGNWAETTKFTAQGGEVIEVTYRISTPESIPSGGQYAVLFAHTISEETSTSGIRTEASPGLLVYGRSSSGEAIRTAEISDLKIYSKETTNSEDGSTAKRIGASARVKNTGNIDFTAFGSLTIQSILWGSSYETSGTDATLSIIPSDDENGTIMTLSDEWKDTPAIGLFKVTWKVTAAEEVQEISQIILIMPIYAIIIMLIILTGIVVWIIISIRKRKERRSSLEA